MKIFSAAVLALCLAVPLAVQAKSTDRNQEMTIESDAQSGSFLGDGVITLSRNVVITQGTLDIRAAQADVHMKDGEAVRAVFTGKQATMKQQLDDGSMMNARADKIDYDIKGEIITLTGNYEVVSAQGTNSGQRMVYNTRTGEMNSGGGGEAGRVRTVIPPKNKGAAPAAKPAAPAKTTVPTAGSKK
ncbi:MULTISPECIES: lipopolysaccharide transport periplasmic protein LptA [Stenotrophomonas]|uniref:lipopolysaccharide transport periplasmic protein LptA n=1 Tax=Stenotrophomonas TaxID=40323 RepID=UPI000873443C|nr:MULTISPECIES: lipopolysaccharide transport periplasmic protein LptA [Stenotrophomonas]OEZ02143.1 lipopolysaccharide transport periplasmic protein LptA [Stenotrophomonas sp. BIIR7]